MEPSKEPFEEQQPPSRASSQVQRGGSGLERPKKSRSVLQRLGVAPLVGAEDPDNMPPRSPTGAIRQGSTLRRRLSAVEATRQAAETEDDNMGGEPWHLMTQEQLLAKLQSSIDGLSDEEAERRLLQDGKNCLTPPKQRHWIIKLLLLFVGGFQLMLLVGSILSFVVYGISKGRDVQSLALAIVLIAVVIFSSLFQYFQEGKADSVMESLRQLSAEKSFVTRSGTVREVPSEDLVVGDVVVVKAGEKVPADVRILSSTDLKVNNAPLTGENVDIKLGTEALNRKLYEAKNVARSGCNFTSGNGTGIVFLTGDRTFFGQIASSTTSVEHPDTLLKRELRRFILIMAVIAIVLGAVFFGLALGNGFSFVNALLFFISIVVANVPEGLLPQLTVALALTAKRLNNVGVIVTNLEIIETLGAVSVICSDKTGTLTCNRMTVAHAAYDMEIHLADKDSPQQAGDSFTVVDTAHPTFNMFVRLLCLNTDATFLQTAEEEPDVLARNVKGDASETAMVKFAQPFHDVAEYRQACKRLAAIPFNSTNKWMLSINQAEGPDSDTKPLLLSVKGAFERVIGMCSGVMIGGVVTSMTPEARAKVEGMALTLGKRGERVIAFAMTELSRSSFPPGFAFETDPPNFPFGGLTLVGLVAMIDPPRPSVRPAIEECHSAGVRVIMVTGDHPITALSIAKSLNIITLKTREELQEEGQVVPSDYHDAIVVHGTEMERFTQDDWDRVLAHKEVVFARTMPQQKQEIVKQLAELGHIVAMTGDGVNDAPALKAAHVGVAMMSGTAVAREAGQLVLVNDDFGAIVAGVREGRLIFENLKKTISYVLASNIPELVPFLLFVIVQIPLAIETIVILMIDLGTDLVPAVALAFEEPEDLLMKRPPRSPDAHLVSLQLMTISYGTIGIMQALVGYFGYAYVMADRGFDLSTLIDASDGFRGDFNDLLAEPARLEFFIDLCLKNQKFLDTGMNCGEEFQEYRNKTLNLAQSAYFAGIVWSQFGNNFIRKTQISSLFSYFRLTNNRAMYVGFLCEIIVLVVLIYVPGLNSAFFLAPLPARFLFFTIWAIPWFILWDETRKALCRLNPNGYWALYTNF